MNRIDRLDQNRQQHQGGSGSLSETTNAGNSNPNGQIFLKYILEDQVLCSQEFRQALITRMNCLSMTPIKCGQGRRYTKSGVLEIDGKNMVQIPKMVEVNGVVVKLEPISFDMFEKLKQKEAVKIFFKGFPISATKSDVQAIFEQFGNIQYSYFMVESKQGIANNKLGYIIYSDREAVERLLINKTPLFFGNNRIIYAEYQPNRKVTKKGKKTVPVYENKPASNVSVIMQKSEVSKPDSKMAHGEKPRNKWPVGQVSNDGYQAYFKRPFLKVSDEVRQNTVSNMNIRFNVYIPSSDMSKSVALHGIHGL